MGKNITDELEESDAQHRTESKYLARIDELVAYYINKITNKKENFYESLCAGCLVQVTDYCSPTFWFTDHYNNASIMSPEIKKGTIIMFLGLCKNKTNVNPIWLIDGKVYRTADIPISMLKRLES